MITNYVDNYYEYLNNNIKEFNFEFLKKENPFLKNYVYLENNEPIGLISYSLIYDRIELEYIWTSFEHRKKGIASKMIQFCIKIAKNEGYKAVYVDVVPTNTPARNLFGKNGFKYLGDFNLDRSFKDIPLFSIMELKL